jgi:hypothetical protein
MIRTPNQSRPASPPLSPTGKFISDMFAFEMSPQTVALASSKPVSPTALERRLQQELRRSFEHQRTGDKRTLSDMQASEDKAMRSDGVTLGQMGQLGQAMALPNIPSASGADWVRQTEANSIVASLGTHMDTCTQTDWVPSLPPPESTASCQDGSGSEASSSHVIDITAFFDELEKSNSLMAYSSWKGKCECALARIQYSLIVAAPQDNPVGEPHAELGHVPTRIHADLEDASYLLRGLSQYDMPLPYQAIFTAALIRQRLSVLAYEPTGQACIVGKGDKQVHRMLGEKGPVIRKGRANKAERAARDCASAEGSQLCQLAIQCANKALGSAVEYDFDGKGQLSFHSRCLQFQDQLHKLSQAQGPGMVALTLKLYDPVWLTRQSSCKDATGAEKHHNSLPKNHCNSFVNAMLLLPHGQLARFIAVAKDPQALHGECESVKAAMKDVLTDTHITGLHHALERLQGYGYQLKISATVSGVCPYAGAPAPDSALTWLKSKD